MMNFGLESLLRMAASAGPPQREQEKDFEKGKWPFGSQAARNSRNAKMRETTLLNRLAPCNPTLRSS
ncbi:hypothetical protein F442_17742 [Phytophthora nicotianae P10297]|uniref:Uncharacterized protein n=2 Tax=Phytophthora nicotianae TaxID=4792 RepID=W2YGN8_PHYNI|nr:hypothetical protein F444_17922 [Phytophthora nicotianae P1976]ETP33788.1 hypothetical protein F442_17742 [Phytophthora nicotianae P10297]